jgi:hypothetical protein
MLADPNVNRTAFEQSAINGRLDADEVGAAIVFGDTVDGVSMSELVFPAWFEGFRAAVSTPFDIRRN